MRKAIVFLCVLLVPCLCLGKQKIIEIQDSIEELRKEIYEVKRQTEKNGAMLEKLSTGYLAQLDQMRIAQAEINQQLESLSRETRILTQKLAESGAARPFQATVDSEPTMAPERPDQPARISASSAARSVYNNAYTDFSLGNWNLAIEGFQEYVERYPKDDLTDNAQYWIGECEYSKNSFDRALRAFDKVIQEYPKSDMIPSAHLKKGIILIGQDKLTLAVLELQHVIDNYPDTPEAEKARERIREIGLSGR